MRRSKKYETLKDQYNAKVASSLNSGALISNAAGADDKAALLSKKNDLEVNLKAESSIIESLNQKIANLNGTLSKDASKGAALQSLLKDAELANKEYLEAKARFNDANDVMASSVNNFRQILAGQPALEPESSKKGAHHRPGRYLCACYRCTDHYADYLSRYLAENTSDICQDGKPETAQHDQFYQSERQEPLGCHYRT